MDDLQKFRDYFSDPFISIHLCKVILFCVLWCFFEVVTAIVAEGLHNNREHVVCPYAHTDKGGA